MSGDNQQGSPGQQPAIAREQALHPLGAEVLLDLVEDIGHAVILAAGPRCIAVPWRGVKPGRPRMGGCRSAPRA